MIYSKQGNIPEKFNEWVHEWPTEPGWYWFFGDRFDRAKEPDICFCQVVRLGDKTIVVVTDGYFMYKRELGKEWWFKKADIPTLPEYGEVR